MLPITDSRMTRLNITLQQKVDFVLECLEKMWGGELFVPGTPSYRITDIAKAIAPDCQFQFVDITPGEKFHEEMIFMMDALNLVEFSDYYVILPSTLPRWDIANFLKESNSSLGELVREGFCYNSGTNPHFLNEEESRHLINSELK